jgi:hypothetical protein
MYAERFVGMGAGERSDGFVETSVTRFDTSGQRSEFKAAATIPAPCKNCGSGKVFEGIEEQLKFNNPLLVFTTMIVYNGGKYINEINAILRITLRIWYDRRTMAYTHYLAAIGFAQTDQDKH